MRSRLPAGPGRIPIRISLPKSLIVLTRRYRESLADASFPAWHIATQSRIGTKNGRATFPGYSFVRANPGGVEGVDRVPCACGLTFAVRQPAVKTKRGLEAFKLMTRASATIVFKPRLGRKN